MRTRELVVDRHRTGDHAGTAAHRGAQDHECDHIARIGMKRQALFALVTATLGTIHVGAEIAHVTEEITVFTLRDGGSEMFSDAQ